MACVLDYSRQPVVFLCTVCKNTKPLPLPLDISQVIALTKDFEAEHKQCTASPR